MPDATPAPAPVVRSRSATPPPPATQQPPAPVAVAPFVSPNLRTGSEFEKVKAHFAKNYGDGIIRAASRLPINRHIQTGAFTLDLALLGGLPENHAFMIYGNESSSKTTMMMKIVAAFQQKYPDKVVVWVDPESTFDKLWAMKQGVDVEALELTQPGSGELAVDIIQRMMAVQEVSLVVLDSIGALCPMNVYEKSAEDKTYAEVARLCSTLCQKLGGVTNIERARGHFPTFGMVNQFRDSQSSYGSPNKLPGGRQINYYATTKIWMKGKKVKGKNSFGDEVTDHIEQAFVVEKHKIGSSIEQGEFIMHLNPDGASAVFPEMQFGQGTILDAKIVAAQAKRIGILSGGGASWRIEGLDMRFGKLAEIESFFYQNPAAYLRVKQQVIVDYRRRAGLPALPPDRYLLDWIPLTVTL